jgi:hypothetical protein
MTNQQRVKKPYEAPTVRRVRLVVRNAVLATCHSSPNLNPRLGAQSCSMVPQGCWNPPGP